MCGLTNCLPPMTTTLHEASSIADLWSDLTPAERNETLAGLSHRDAQRILYDWDVWARADQRAPKALPDGTPWFCWALISGRGAGKTRTGAETVKQWAGGPNDPPIRIALVAESVPDARDVMVEGESGLLAVCPPWNRPEYQPSKRRLVWPNGTIATTFSGDKPDLLRGPQFHKAWVDELAKFQYPERVWDNLEFGLRLGLTPQVLVTTTPRPIKVIKDLLLDAGTIVTRVSTYANLSNLSANFIRRVVKKYEGTRLGRQELHAELLLDTQGALWTYGLIEKNRVAVGPQRFDRVVIGVDPSASVTDDANETGIMVVGKVGDTSYVLRDASNVFTPDAWAQMVILMYQEYGASLIVAEKNQGGVMVADVIRTRWKNAPIKLVHATESKEARAEPVAALMEQGRIKHIGQFARLEDQMCATTPDGYQGRGSPDRMDAMVWGVTELMLRGTHSSYAEEDYVEYHR